MKWIAASLVLVLALGAVGYLRVGWSRMETQCSSETALSAHSSSGVAYSWTWSPVGFTCTYDDGSSETSLWY